MRQVRRSLAGSCVAGLILLAGSTACGASPSTPSDTKPDATVFETVGVTGQLLAGSSDVPVAGATLRLLSNLGSGGPPAVTDADGRFTMTGIVASDDVELRISVSRTVQGSWPMTWYVAVPRAKTDQAVVRVPGLVVVRAGKTVRGELASGPAQIACTFESVPCLPLIVDGPPSTWIELELIPDNDVLLGLVETNTFLAPGSYPTRMTVPPGAMWIMGGFSSFTLKARDVTQAR